MAEIQTRDLLIASQAPYRYATEPHDWTNSMWMKKTSKITKINTLDERQQNSHRLPKNCRVFDTH